MMKSRYLAPVVLALLATGCAGIPQDADTAPQTSTVAPTPAPASNGPGGGQEKPPGVTASMDASGAFAGEVGQTVGLSDAESGAMINATLDAVEYVKDTAAPTGLVALLQFTYDNTRSDRPVQLYAPIDGAGWMYLPADNTVESFYDNGSGYLATWEGEGVDGMWSGPFMAGKKVSPMVAQLVVDEPGGAVGYVDTEGNLRAAFRLPEESTPTTPVLDKVHKLAGAHLVEADS